MKINISDFSHTLEFSTVSELTERINRAAAAGRPFLWAVDYELSRGLFVADPLEQQHVLFRTPSCRNYEPNCGADCATSAKKLEIVRRVSYEHYKQQYDVIQQGLRHGDSFLANLTTCTEVSSEWSLEEIFRGTHSDFGLYIPGVLACFSPERFVRITDNGTISSFPIKGTINALLPDARRRILEDHKELCEHRTIVDLIRNDLGMVATGVRVVSFRDVTTIESAGAAILQVSSHISGTLPATWRDDLGTTIMKLLPAGSICGAPKEATVELIRRAEDGQDRGFYTGVFGYFDGRRMDSAVLIRMVESRDGRLFYRSGGGVTVNSDPVDEYSELFSKIYLPG